MYYDVKYNPKFKKLLQLFQIIITTILKLKKLLAKNKFIFYH